MANFLKKGAFLLIAILAPLVIANEILRFTYIKNYYLSKYFVYNSEFIYSLKKNFHEKLPFCPFNPKKYGKNPYWELKINSQGIRADETIQQKSPSTIRIICIGDSVTFGHEVDAPHSYPFLLKKILQKFYGQSLRVEVINAGISGYTSRQGLVYLKKSLLQFQPDWVILEFGPNDVKPNIQHFFLKDKQILQGNVKTGFKKISQSPLVYTVMLISRQPLLLSIYNLTGFFIFPVIDKYFLKPLRIQTSPTSKNIRWSYTRVPPADFLDNYLQFIWLAEHYQFKLLIYLPYGIFPYYRSLLLNLAYEHKIPVVDFSEGFSQYQMKQLENNPNYTEMLSFYINDLGKDFLTKKPQYLFTTDEYHPNGLGNQLIAEKMANVIMSYSPVLQVKNSIK